MPTITGSLKDSLRTVANGWFLTGLPQAAAFQDTLILPQSAAAVAGGAVSVAPVPNAQLVPDALTYNFGVLDLAGIQRYAASGVTVTAVMDTLDDIL